MSCLPKGEDVPSHGVVVLGSCVKTGPDWSEQLTNHYAEQKVILSRTHVPLGETVRLISRVSPLPCRSHLFHVIHLI
jgi:hypothetical protein